MTIELKIRSLEERLAELEKEKTSLLKNIGQLRKEFSAQQKVVPLFGRPVSSSIPESISDKVALFLKLFCAREDVHPKRWENHKTGKQGYSPVCGNEWVKPICQKPQIKCADCPHQKFLPLDEIAVEAHLRGSTPEGLFCGIQNTNSFQ